jgi:hypothetical protein
MGSGFLLRGGRTGAYSGMAAPSEMRGRFQIHSEKENEGFQNIATYPLAA